MRRREFCKLHGGNGRGNGCSPIPPECANSGASVRWRPRAPHRRRARLWHATPRTMHSSARRPESERVFYALEDGKIVSEKLDEQMTGSRPTGASRRRCPFPAARGTACRWIRPSRTSREKDLTSPPGIRCCSTKRPSGIATRSSASGRTGARSVCPKRATGTAATCTSRATGNTNISLSTTARPRASASRISALSGRCSTGSRMS